MRTAPRLDSRSNLRSLRFQKQRRPNISTATLVGQYSSECKLEVQTSQFMVQFAKMFIENIEIIHHHLDAGQGRAGFAMLPRWRNG